MVSYYPVLQKEVYEYKVLSHDCPVEMHTMWTNFQSKGDFNPLHRHSGIYSFIIKIVLYKFYIFLITRFLNFLKSIN